MFDCNSVDNVFEEIRKYIQKQNDYKEKALAEIIANYDFVVGSIECKYKLMEVLPEGANIVCLPYFTSPTTIYAIKKFDVMKLLLEPEESEEDKNDKT